MPGAAGRTLNGLFKAAFVIGILAVALLALLVAWWIALLAAAVWLLVRGVRQLFQGGSRKPAARASTAIIDGEYRVEYGNEPPVPLTVDKPEGGRPRE